MASPFNPISSNPNSIPEQFPAHSSRGKRRNPHKTEQVSSGRPFDHSRSHKYLDTTGRQQSHDQATFPSGKRTRMHIPSTESDANHMSMPHSARTRRGSVGQSELGRMDASQHAPSSGPIRNRRNQSREELASRPAVQNTVEYPYPPQTTETDPYQFSTSSNMQMPGQPQDQTRQIGYRPVMHDSIRSLPHSMESQQVSRPDHMSANSHTFAPQTRHQELPVHTMASNEPIPLPSIDSLHYDLNQPSGEFTPRYAVQPQPRFSPNHPPHAEMHRQHHYPQRDHAGSYGQAQVYPAHQQQGRQWDRVEHTPDNDANQHNVYVANPHHQQQHWQSHGSAPVQGPPPPYEQHASVAGPIRRTHQQSQQHQRSYSLASQPYERPGAPGHTRPASMSSMYSQHTPMPSSGQIPSMVSYAQSGPNTVGLALTSHPSEQGPQERQYNQSSKQYSLESRATQSPTQLSQAGNPTLHSLHQVHSQQSPLGTAPGFKRFGSPEVSNEVSHQARGTPPVASVHASGAEQETDYSTPASAFQLSRSHLGTPKGPDPVQPSNTRNPESAELSDTPVRRYMAETTHGGGRREKRKDPRPHKCLDCGKGFPRPSALATHMSVHSGDKPYNCPVVSCNKSFAVRSNARRHLKTHGIKLKARDRPRKSGSTKQPADSGDEENDNETDDDATVEQPNASSTSTRHGVSSIAVTSLTKPPPDRGLGTAFHRGHANLHANVHTDPSGLGASLSMFGDEHSGTVLERVKRSTRTSEQRNRWEMEMSGGVKLRTVRKEAASGRSRRGLRSEELVSNARKTTDGDETLQEDEDEEDTVHELEEDALLRLCPVREEPSTPQMPQLDKEDLDKLIAPPMAWDGFQKQKMLQEAESKQHSLEQRHTSHEGTDASITFQATDGSHVPLYHSDVGRRASTSTMVSSSTLKSTPPNGYTLPTAMDDRAPPLGSTFVFTHQGFRSSNGTEQPSPAFHTSSMRSSAVSLVPAMPDGTTVIGDLSTPPTRRHSYLGSFSSVSPRSGSEEVAGNFRDDGTWVSTSMNGFSNVARLRNSEPFDDLGLQSVQLAVPLATVQPRQTSSPDGGGKREERDSYAVDIGSYPYHPIHFDRRPILAGPASPSHNITSWRSASLIST